MSYIKRKWEIPVEEVLTEEKEKIYDEFSEEYVEITYLVADETKLRPLLLKHIELPPKELRNKAINLIETNKWKETVKLLCNYYKIQEPILLTRKEGTEISKYSVKFTKYLINKYYPHIDFNEFIVALGRTLDVTSWALGSVHNKLILVRKPTPNVVIHEFFHYLDSQLFHVRPTLSEPLAYTYEHMFLNQPPEKIKLVRI